MKKIEIFDSFISSLEGISDDMTIMIGGFGGQGGQPTNLMLALKELNVKNITLVGNVAGLSMITGYGWIENDKEKAIDQNIFFHNNQVKKIICSFPVPSQRKPFSEIEKSWRNNETIVEIIPQGTLAEKIRAAGSGIPAFYTKTGIGTIVEENKETKIINGEKFILEYALSSDIGLINANHSDEFGNLVYLGTSRAFNPIMAAASKFTIAEVDKIISSRLIDPERIGTSGIYINRIVSKKNEIS
tara:strand:+ start:882 stop:1613 length:732 start_codon:yes stop_codon:yes gene_type:complete